MYVLYYMYIVYSGDYVHNILYVFMYIAVSLGTKNVAYGMAIFVLWLYH